MVTVTFSGDWEELTLSAEGHAASPQVCAAVSMLMQAMEAWTMEGALCQLHCGEKGKMELSFLHTDESYAAAGLLLCGFRMLKARYPGEVTLRVEGEIYPMDELCLDRFGEEGDPAAGDSAAAPQNTPDPAGQTAPQEEGKETAGDSAALPERSAEEGLRALAAAGAIAAELARRSRDRLIRGMARSPGMIADDLLRQSEALRRDYEDFSLETELQDPRFRRLVRGGAALREAYEALHADRVRAAAEAETLRRIRLRGLRPPENGAARAVGTLSGGAAALTPADRDALARRALAGERITF